MATMAPALVHGRVLASATTVMQRYGRVAAPGIASGNHDGVDHHSDEHGAEHGAEATGRTAGHDAGPALLASLAAGGGLDEPELVEHVLQRWLADLPQQPLYLGAFEGLAALFAGARAASTLHPRFGALAATVAERLAGWSSAGHWRTSTVAWEDYDLISGPAGVVLALGTDDTAVERALPAARHLVRLCEPGLAGLRMGDDRGDQRRGWNLGRVNVGLGHGVAGVAAALRAVAAAAPEPEEFRRPLRIVCEWLADESYIDDRGLLTWPPASLESHRPPPGASRRQAWCYGTPGVAWTLWDAGRALGDQRLQAFAEGAMRSFCTGFDETYHLDDEPIDANLGICHGAAGTLAVADAFARHAGLPAAARLRNRLTEHVLRRLTDVADLAERNMSLLTGATGVLCVLLTVSGGPRGWLSQIALR